VNTHEILGHFGIGTRYVLDMFSITVAVGAIVQLLPPLAAAFTILWTGLQIFGWFEARRLKSKPADAEKRGK
jgi:hypothetical protein